MFIVGFALAGLGHRFEWMMFPWWTTVFEVLGLSLNIEAKDIPESTLRENATKRAAHKTNPPKEPPSNTEADGTLDAIAILTGAAKQSPPSTKQSGSLSSRKSFPILHRLSQSDTMVEKIRP